MISFPAVQNGLERFRQRQYSWRKGSTLDGIGTPWMPFWLFVDLI
jgi:hypothetical protein